jgi:hypothetical protein
MTHTLNPSLPLYRTSGLLTARFVLHMRSLADVDTVARELVSGNGALRMTNIVISSSYDVRTNTDIVFSRPADLENDGEEETSKVDESLETISKR